MSAVPELCKDRTVIGDSQSGIAVCHVLSRITGVTDPSVCRVRRDACVACCQSLRSPGEMNPVIASLLYSMTSEIVDNGGHPECRIDKARSLRQRSLDQLSFIVEELPGEAIPPSMPLPVRHSSESTTRSPKQFRWAAAMLTAPRAESQIEWTLESVDKAGFGRIRIFAEPSALIPRSFPQESVTYRERRLGNFLNFYSCLTTLLTEQPDADAYAVFQDDITVASGLRAWCEAELWPLGCGLVSLFTPRLHSSSEKGWRIVSPGFQRVCGAQALVFRRDLLERFLSDGRVIHSLRRRQHCDDAILGGWLSREGLGIAYHTPSPVQHIGRVSSLFPGGHDLRNLANAVESVDQIPIWISPEAVPGTIGLVGWNTTTGLGSLNRDLVRHLGIRQWLVPPHPVLPTVSGIGFTGVEIQEGNLSQEQLLEWVRGLDWLLFAERPYLEELPRFAAHNGVGVACIPMWEWLHPELPWLQFVDLMICPNHLSFNQMEDWTRRYGFGWKCVLVPWPIDHERFRFHERRVCREFLFVNGWGGGGGQRLDGTHVPYCRKGLELIVATAEMAPDLKFVVRSLAPMTDSLPDNMRLLPEPASELDLYDVGDVCVQPSHYEGLGLQLLECQAAGLPLVTTAAAPMNETNPWRVIPTCGQEVIRLWETYLCSELMSPETLVATLRPLVGMDLCEASHQARSYIERERNWEMARWKILDELVRR